MRAFIVFVFAFVGAAAFAAERDRNEDGRITWREAQTGALVRFAEIDANGDERLSEAELRAVDADLDAWLALDRNGDGLIDPREHNGLLMIEMGVFADCDRDGDGELAGDEVACFDQ